MFGAGKHYKAHETVVHSRKKFQRGKVHTNTVEGYFGIFKRGLVGVYQHMGSQHLHRYLTEFEFRYNARDITDVERTAMALLSIGGKRLEYKELVGRE